VFLSTKECQGNARRNRDELVQLGFYTEMTSPDRVIHGYQSLAAFIASDNDQSASIYKAHRRISARNLLYHETELSELEAELDALDQEDLDGGFEGKKYARLWTLLRESPDARHVEEVKLITKMRETVKEYREFGEREYPDEVNFVR
jgi:hypothetical protein